MIKKDTGDLIGHKIADKITKKLQQNNSETIINEHDKEILIVHCAHL